MPGRATSSDGTVICFDQYGTGPVVVLVHGALTDRGFPTLVRVAERLASRFSVFNYDRRGRGESGDTAPYDVSREIDDLRAVIEAAGGDAMIFGGSSGGGLALRAAAAIPSVSKIAVWEPPYHVAQGAPVLSEDFAERLTALVRAGRRADAVEKFMVEAAGMHAADVTAMRAGPSWARAEAIAHTLAYEAAVMGPGNTLPAASLAGLTMPVLVLTGELSPAWLISAGRLVTAAIPAAVHRVLAGQTHGVSADALAPELLQFFTA
jgi:pimeloyl-ACP methyl ester carboxylesterase